MNIILDSHEGKLIELMPTVHSKQMDVGDIHYINDAGIVSCIIERKTYADLYSSIIDKRYSEQKQRLRAFKNDDETVPMLIFLIEGPKTVSSYIDYAIIDSALLGMTLRDGFNVIYSDNIGHTVKLINKLQHKLGEYLEGPKKESYLTTLKICKKDNLTPTSVYTMQIAQIPGVSLNMAELITEVYSSMYMLINAIMVNRTEVFNVISNIKIKTRKIGKVLAGKVLDYIAPDVIIIPVVNVIIPVLVESPKAIIKLKTIKLKA